MNARIFLLTVGLLALFAPGCCLLHHGCGSGCGSGCGCGCGLLGCISKIRDKIHNCCLCKSHSCVGDCGCSCGGGGMMSGGMGMSMGDCGCGGGMPAGGDCGCGVPGGHVGHGGHGGHHEGTFMTPPMTVPSMSPAPPVPTSGVTMPPAIPPAESGSISPVPQGTQQVSVEEFQRLPGVVISGPGSQATATSTPQMAAQPSMSVPTTVAAPTSAARSIQQTSATTVAPANAKQVQQTGWAPVRQ